MRYLNAFLCVLLTGFTIVQYNDPDAPLWILIYGLPAIGRGLPRTAATCSPTTSGSSVCSG